ncbi:MAG TPA: vanadium-dependent haloperoxidase [Puia sp.]|nr:vanadium-dependent haloperoxidase [Puia sp.]
MLFFWAVLLSGVAAVPKARAQKDEGPALTSYLRPAIFSLTMVMLHDVVSPPAASRYYSYVMLGAYDLVAEHDPALVPPGVFIQHYPGGEKGGSGVSGGGGAVGGAGAADTGYDYRIAAVFSILETGRQMLPSGYMLANEEAKFLRLLKEWKIPQRLIDRSVAAGRRATEKVIGFSKGDRYNLLSAKLRYTPFRKDSTWYPTPPAYMEAVDPNWRIIRPMVIDSSDQFMPPPLTRFSTDTGSLFYRLATEVYTISKDTGARSLYERTIAGFWDCNPFAVTTSGHMNIGLKKISPGAHWLDIAANAAGVAGLDFDQTVETQTLVAVTLMDAFIACWDEKYRSNRIRPETYIDRYIDPHWQPYLQTPPFPEYTSGHSVISTASAEVLTYLLGESLDYTDNAEELFDITPRSFHSFRAAAAEAAISRLYGGIHYRDGVVSGQVQGKILGDYLVGKFRAAGIRPLR